MKKIFLMAAAVATLFASCAKEENGGGKVDSGEAKAAQVGFSFEIPTPAPATRAETQISTNDEVKVNRISVFIFDETGAPATLNPYTHFDAADVALAFATTNNTVGQKTRFTLNEEYYIETVSGKAHLYVGINLPASLDHAYASEAALWAAKSNANAEGMIAPETGETHVTGEGFATPADFTMFGQAMDSGKPEITLNEYVEGDDQTLTEVPVIVERVVSKVVGTTQAAVFTAVKQGADAIAPAAADYAVWTKPAAAAGLQLIYTIQSYNVYNEMSESYLAYQAGKSVWASIYDDLQSYFKDLAGNTTAFVLGTSTGKNMVIGDDRVYDITASNHQLTSAVDPTLAGLEGFYIGENYSNKNPSATNLSRNESTTYAMVATTVSTNKIATWDESVVGDNVSKVAWSNAPSDRTEGTEDLFIVRAFNGETNVEEIYISTDKDEAEDIQDGLYALTTDGETMEGDRSNAVYSSSVLYDYLDSYVHFKVWLNRDGFNDYNIGRNQFVHLHVTGIVGMDGNGNGLFPGNPGDPDDPKKPIDPDGDDPTGPVDGTQAKLKVVITVKDWTYKYNGGVLSK